jgi:hypothetical protein
MKSMKQNPLRLVPIAAAAILATGVWAAPPASSPYATDGANEYVQDSTSDGISNLNMVLCIMHAMSPSDMLTSKGVLNTSTGITEVQYRALVDKNKCDTKSRASAGNSASGSSGATATPSYMTAIVDVSRGSNATDPMIGKVWMQLTENGASILVSIKFTATSAPTASKPYGVLRLDYAGYQGTTLGFNGYIDANGAAVNYLETGNNSSDVALALNAQDTTSGNGIIQSMQNNGGSPVTLTYTFAYNPVAFDRNSGGGSADVCFDRAKANAEKSVWRYGIYDATTGARIDQANPGFPVTATYAGTSYYGFAGYWGINFQNLDLNSIADASPISALTVTDQRPTLTGTTYNLSKVGGKLTKWTQHQATLDQLDGIPFTFNGDLTTATSDSSVTGWGNWQLVWSTASHNFTLIGMQACGNNGCVISTRPTPATVNAGALNSVSMSGWSDAFGGNLNIPSTGSPHVSTDAIYFFSQSTVTPGSQGAPSALYCLSQCPTTDSLAAFQVGSSSTSPFDPQTAQQWFSAVVGNTVSYTFDAQGLEHSKAGTLTPMVVEQASQIPQGSPFQNGVMTGRLFDTVFQSSSTCPPNAPNPSSCVQEPANPTAYYTWSTGPNQWNQALWLTKTSDSSLVAFDPPANITYTVPANTLGSLPYGSWAGKTIQLQFNGFGNLYGIPGDCVDPQTNLAANCNVAGSRYVPAFSLADGAALTLGGTGLLVRALDDELRLRQIPCSGTGLSTAGVSTTLPTALPHNPTLASDTGYYIGTAPSVTGAPSVIDGVLQ